MFYLSHLLSYTSKSNERPAMQLGIELDIELDKNREFATTHSIGAKFMNKRLLTDKVRDRCPVCTSVSIGYLGA